MIKKSIPSILTFIRIIISIFFIFPATVYYGPNYFIGIIFILISITDFFDGYLARLFKVGSYFGSIIDPLADKILTISAMLPLCLYGKIPIMIIWVLIIRDIIVMSIREYSQKNNFQIKPNFLAKLKTAFILVSISFIYFGFYINIFIWIFIMLLIFFSGFNYIKILFKNIY